MITCPNCRVDARRGVVRRCSRCAYQANQPPSFESDRGDVVIFAVFTTVFVFCMLVAALGGL